jgi:hypothetical protein
VSQSPSDRQLLELAGMRREIPAATSELQSICATRQLARVADEEPDTSEVRAPAEWALRALDRGGLIYMLFATVTVPVGGPWSPSEAMACAERLAKQATRIERHLVVAVVMQALQALLRDLSLRDYAVMARALEDWSPDP